jgi:arginase
MPPRSRPLNDLRVIEVQFQGAVPTASDRWAFDAYRLSGAYEAGGVPPQVVRPMVQESALTWDAPTNMGVIAGAIADAVAEGSGRRLVYTPPAILMVGGNCNHATGVLGGLQDIYGAAARIGLVWFDAHGDFNTPQTTLSGSLGGMPVAVCAGLCLPSWREGSHIAAPLPSDRIVLCDVRNLDPAEETLIRAIGVSTAAPAPGFPGCDLQQAIDELARHVDMIYLHVDADILDVSYMPNHLTKEPNGPSMEQVLGAIELVMATSQVVAYAVVSVFPEGDGGQTSVTAGIQLIRGGLQSWQKHGMPDL